MLGKGEREEREKEGRSPHQDERGEMAVRVVRDRSESKRRV